MCGLVLSSLRMSRVALALIFIAPMLRNGHRSGGIIASRRPGSSRPEAVVVVVVVVSGLSLLILVLASLLRRVLVPRPIEA